jgi:bacterioferritin
MQGDPEIVDVLNEVLTAELTAVNQYFLHSKLCANWGYRRLAEHARKESIGEMHDADEIMERILLLDGHPNVQRLGAIRAGETVVEQLEADAQLERDAITRLREAIGRCHEAGDHGTRELLERILVGEESHLDWIESQQHVIAEIGEAHYLAQQLHD